MPALTSTPSPGFTTLAARCSVLKGADWVPALASLPVVATYQQIAPERLPQEPVATGAVIETLAVPFTVSLVAVMVLDPAASAVTRPELVTLALPALELAQ